MISIMKYTPPSIIDAMICICVYALRVFPWNILLYKAAYDDASKLSHV